MIRLFFFIIKLALLVAAAIWLVSQQGQVIITGMGYEVSLRLPTFLFGLILLIILSLAIFSLWRAIVAVPRALSLAHLTRRQRKGYQALTEGLMAVAAGDGTRAQRLAKRASDYLQEPNVTLFLQAQAAHMAGDDKAAAQYYNTMVQRPALSAMGLRGMITSAMQKGDSATALTLARRAKMLHPKADWLHGLLLELEAQNGQWQAASDVLSLALKQGSFTPDQGKGLRATLNLALAQQADKQGDRGLALRLAKKAHEFAPSFAPAALFYAQKLKEVEQAKQATKVIERAWRTQPQADLAALYLSLVPPETSATQLLRRAEQLASFNPSAPESDVMIAQAALKAHLWGIARNALDRLNSRAPSRAMAQLFATLEVSEHQDHTKAEAWKDRALTLAADPYWHCDSCKQSSPTWQPLCRHCGSVGKIVYQHPDNRKNLLV